MSNNNKSLAVEEPYGSLGDNTTQQAGQETTPEGLHIRSGAFQHGGVGEHRDLRNNKQPTAAQLIQVRNL